MLAILVSSLPMIVCGVLSVLIVLSLYDCRNMAKTRLLFFMATATLLYLAHFIYFNRLMAVIPLTDAIYCICNLAVFPLYYLYIVELTDYRPNRWRQAIYLLPSLLGGVAVGLLYILMDRQEMTLFIEHYLYGNEFASLSGLTFWQAMIHIAVRIVFALQVPLVLYFGFRRITAYNAVVETNYSDIEGKRIIRVKTLLVLFAVTSLASFIFNLIGRQRFMGEAVPLAIPAVLFSMLLLLIGHVGLNQRFSVQDIEAEVFLESEPIPEDCAYSELLEKIRKLMSEEKLYLYPNLRVSDLARLLNSNRNYIYNAINVEMGISFSDYINSQRIDYASQLLKAHPELSINDVMFKSGFTSTSAFYRNFKKFKGITPTARRTR